MTRIAQSALEELAALCEKATPGRWYTDESLNSIYQGRVVAIQEERLIEVCVEPAGDDRQEDMNFIAAASPKVVAGLVAEIERLRGALAKIVNAEPIVTEGSAYSDGHAAGVAAMGLLAHRALSEAT